MLEEEIRKVDVWTARYRLATVEFPNLEGPDGPLDPFFNTNPAGRPGTGGAAAGMSDGRYTTEFDPQMRAVLDNIAARCPEAWSVPEVPVAEARRRYAEERRFWNAERVALHEVRDLAVEGPHGAVPLRLYHPVAERPLPALVFLHGGGWILGSNDTHDRIMRLLAQKSGAAVVGVDYRLAPEHKFPVAYEECLAVVEQLAADGGTLGLDPARLALGGDSAGANMSLAVALALRDSKPAMLSTLLLYYGVFGLRDGPARRLFGGPAYGLSRADMAYYHACYLRDAADEEDPRFDLLDRDLVGLPPSYLCAAGLDPLLDDSLALAAALARDGVPHDLEIYDGMLHGFLHYSAMADKAMAALEAGAAALRRAFAAMSQEVADATGQREVAE